MDIPQRLWRFPTRAAINELAARFDLPNGDWMQDWEYTVSDANRIDEFLDSYKNDGLSDDERFVLMEVIIDSFMMLKETVFSPLWPQTQQLIEHNIELHFYTVCYWACLDHEENELEWIWECAPQMRALLNRHRARFDFPPYDV